MTGSAQPPGWDGRPRGEPGIHGVARLRRWDAVVAVRAQAEGDHAAFVKLANGDVIGEVAPALADALDQELPPPYRAEAVRRGGDTWGVAGSAIEVVELPGLRGSEAELVVTRDGRSLRVDGLPAFDRIPALEEAGEAAGNEYVVRAMRLAGEAWEVEATPL